MKESFQKAELAHLRDCEKKLSGMETQTTYERTLAKATDCFHSKVSRLVSRTNEKFLLFLDSSAPLLRKYHQPTHKLRAALEEELKLSASQPLSDLDLAKRLQRLGNFLESFTLAADLIERRSEVSVSVALDVDEDDFAECLMRSLRVKVRVMNEEVALPYQQTNLLIKESRLEQTLAGVREERDQEQALVRELERAMARESELEKGLQQMKEENECLRGQL